jgi:hypothetical protein
MKYWNWTILTNAEQTSSNLWEPNSSVCQSDDNVKRIDGILLKSFYRYTPWREAPYPTFGKVVWLQELHLLNLTISFNQDNMSHQVKTLFHCFSSGINLSSPGLWEQPCIFENNRLVMSDAFQSCSLGSHLWCKLHQPLKRAMVGKVMQNSWAIIFSMSFSSGSPK